jgi:hypothetical protein
MKQCKSEKSFVSLRDVERFVSVTSWFCKQLETGHLGKLIFDESIKAQRSLYMELGHEDQDFYQGLQMRAIYK